MWTQGTVRSGHELDAEEHDAESGPVGTSPKLRLSASFSSVEPVLIKACLDGIGKWKLK